MRERASYATFPFSRTANPPNQCGMSCTRYLIALGSNRRHVRHGGPADVLNAAVEALEKAGMQVKRASAIHQTPALGPAGRDFANAVLLVESDDAPARLLRRLKKIERSFGRRGGKRWGSRVLDLDIIMWSNGAWPDRLRWHSARSLAVPHRSMTERAFVLEPAAEIAPDWRHPITGLTVRQHLARLNRARPMRI